MDFLLQLIFLGLIIGVIYASLQTEEAQTIDPKPGQEALEELRKIKNMLGISDLTNLTDELSRLAPLQATSMFVAVGKDLEVAVSGVGGTEQAKKILEKHIILKAGQGKPSCLQNGAILAVLDAYEDRIEIQRPLTADFEKLLLELGLEKHNYRFKLAEFKANFSPLLSKHPDCRYNVKIIEHSFDTRPRDAIRGTFWTKDILKKSLP